MGAAHPMMATFKSGVRRVAGDARVRRLKVSRLRLLERMPVVDRPHTALNGLDRALIPLVESAANATFLEFGANDGIQQSNTYVLERDHGWTGVLVEPVVALAAECVRNRPRAQVVCAAVGAPRSAGSVIPLVYRDLMTSVGDGGDLAVGVTISSLIEELLDGRVGLVVVDVEGFELQALAGLDLERHQPEFLLVESADPLAVADLLGAQYRGPVQLSHHDYLFARA